MMNPAISVIVPIYNGERYLHECVDSILNQTLQNIEVILVDNKSTDNTGHICDDYQTMDHRVKVIHRSEHGWICDGRNDGIDNSNGKWITFVDADDWLDKDHYEKVLNSIGANEYDIYCQGGCIFDYPSKKVKHYTGTGDFSFQERSKIIELATHIFVPLRNNESPINLSAPWDKFYSRAFITNNSIHFDERVLFADDSFFNLIAFTKASSIGGTSHIGYHYRQVATSITHKYRPDWPEKIYNYLTISKEYLQTENIRTELQNAFNFTALRCLLNMLRGCYLNPSIELSNKEIRSELNMWKNKDIFHDAIYQKRNPLLSNKLRIFQMVMKTNSFRLLKIMLKMERRYV